MDASIFLIFNIICNKAGLIRPEAGRFRRKLKKGGTLLESRFSALEPKAGLEPATYALRMRCSTN